MYLTVNGARLFWDSLGPSLAVDADGMKPRPALIALHGGPGFDHSSMRPYFDRFADTHQVFFIDHRGNGRSNGEPDTWTLDQWGDDLASFCDELGIESPAVFGQSFGGMAAMAFATRHPDKVGKLILSSTAARMRLEDTYAMMERLGGQEAADIARRFWDDPTPKGANEYMARCLPLYNPTGDDAAAAVRARAIMRLQVMFRFIQGEQRTMNFLPALSRVTSPTLVLVGGLDPITPVACAEEIYGALPPGLARLEVFDNAGHGVHRDEPERAETILRAFLDETDR